MAPRARDWNWIVFYNCSLIISIGMMFLLCKLFDLDILLEWHMAEDNSAELSLEYVYSIP